MKKYYLSVLAALSITSSAFAGGPEDYIGSMWPTAAQFCPVDTVVADGTIYPIYQYQALAALYGAAYGGDGRTTFGVPDMRGRMPVGTGVIPGTSYTIQRGTKVGQETTTLVSSNLPTHTHTATFTRGSSTNPITVTVSASSNIAGNANQPSATYNYIAASSNGTGGANMWASVPSSTPVNLAGITSSGGTGAGTVSVAAAGTAAPTAFTTIPPQLGLRFCIVTNGNWPENPNN